MDISGMTLRGAVVQDGVIMLDCAVTGASTALVTWPRLAAGCGAYDIFLTDASGKEYPLLKGAVHVVSRVTPPDGTEDAAAVAGALDVSIPETEDGSVTIVETRPLWSRNLYDRPKRLGMKQSGLWKLWVNRWKAGNWSMRL